MADDRSREFGVIGLGRMGGNLALQALDKGHRVVGLTHKDLHEELLAAGMTAMRSVRALTDALAPPWRVFLSSRPGRRMEVAIPVIVQSVLQRFANRDRDNNSTRAVAMMRHRFGKHPYGPDEAVANERRGGRAGCRPGE